jgi:parallel beta-helix repeat protein
MASKHRITVGEELRFDSDVQGLRNLNGTYVPRGQQVLDAMDYGVVADGTTDDAAAWNAFLSARASGDVVLLRPGKTSLIGSAISVPAGAAGLVFVGWGATLKLSASAPSGTVMLNFSPNGGQVLGLTLDANGATNATGIRPKGQRQRINGCRLVNAPAGGLYIQGTTSDLVVDGNAFSGGGYGVLFDPGYTGSRVTITGNSFTGGASGDAIEVNTPTGGASDISITNNVISGYANTGASGIGIGLAKVTGAVVSGNTVTNCGSDGIHVEDASSDISITGNRVTGCARSGISLQIGAGAGAPPTRVSIVANTITGCCTGNGSGGIALEGATALTGNVVSHNTVRGCGRAGATVYGIDLGAGGTGHVVVGNIVSNTVGSSTAGIRWNAATDYVVMGNKCFDDQGTKTQQYPMRIYGVNSNVLVIANQMNGHLTSNAPDESSINGGSSGYLKRYNRPSGIDNAEVLPVFSGAVSDASFGTVVPLNGSTAIDQTNGRLYFKYGNAWHYVTQTA